MGDLNRYGFTFDALLQLQDTNSGNAIAASQFGKVGGSPVLIDVGDDVFEGAIVIDVSALTASNANNLYRFVVQGATRGTGSTQDAPVLGSTIEDLGELEIGNSAARDGAGATVTSTAGRYYIWLRTVQNDTHYPILRVYLKVSGTNPSLTLQGGGIWIGKIPY